MCHLVSDKARTPAPEGAGDQSVWQGLHRVQLIIRNDQVIALMEQRQEAKRLLNSRRLQADGRVGPTRGNG